MVITVILHTVLQVRNSDGRPVSQIRLELPNSSVVADVLQQLDIHRPEDDLIVAVNRRVCGLEQALHEGDTLDIIPALSGGND